MPLGLRCAISACLGASFVFPLLPTHATAQTVLAGLGFDFTKGNNTNFMLPENQDRITPDVWLTRDYTGGIFNVKHESIFMTRDPTVLSPLHTEWATTVNNPGATILSENWESLTFDPWLVAYGGAGNLAYNIEGLDAVLRILGDDDESDLDDLYMELSFTDWSQGGGGGFAYSRSQFPTGDYNGDETVNAADYTDWRNTLGQQVPNGTGADGEPNGVIDVADYDFWKAHFGDVISLGAGGQSFAVPEPASAAILWSGLMLLTTFPRFSTAGQRKTIFTEGQRRLP